MRTALEDLVEIEVLAEIMEIEVLVEIVEIEVLVEIVETESLVEIVEIEALLEIMRTENLVGVKDLMVAIMVLEQEEEEKVNVVNIMYCITNETLYCPCHVLVLIGNEGSGFGSKFNDDDQEEDERRGFRGGGGGFGGKGFSRRESNDSIGKSILTILWWYFTCTNVYV